MHVVVLSFLAGFFGALSSVFLLGSLGSDYWLMVFESCGDSATEVSLSVSLISLTSQFLSELSQNSGWSWKTFSFSNNNSIFIQSHGLKMLTLKYVNCKQNKLFTHFWESLVSQTFYYWFQNIQKSDFHNVHRNIQNLTFSIMFTETETTCLQV